MRILLVFFISLVAISSCSNKPEVEDIPVIEIESPFQDFLGLWTLESRLVNGESETVRRDNMFIEEDANRSDNFATGYYDIFGGIRKPIRLELTEIENQILIYVDPVTMDCRFTFLGESTMELDDSYDDFLIIATWVKED